MLLWHVAAAIDGQNIIRKQFWNNASIDAAPVWNTAPTGLGGGNPFATASSAIRTATQCTAEDETALQRCADPLYEIGALRMNNRQDRQFTWEFFTQNGRPFFEELCR
jgi:hypothetical protein